LTSGSAAAGIGNMVDCFPVSCCTLLIILFVWRLNGRRGNPMLIEHTFVTTLEAPQAMELACSFLRELGFAVSNLPSVADGAWLQSLELTRGDRPHPDPRRSRQTVHLAFDRGRMTIATSISPARRGSFGISASSIGGEPSATSQWGQPHAQRMVALADTLESLIARGQSPQEVWRSWMAIENASSRKAFAARQSSMIKGTMIALVVLLLIVCLIGSANSRSRSAEAPRSDIATP
jgi:hypothetical protein